MKSKGMKINKDILKRIKNGEILLIPLKAISEEGCPDLLDGKNGEIPAAIRHLCVPCAAIGVDEDEERVKVCEKCWKKGSEIIVKEFFGGEINR